MSQNGDGFNLGSKYTNLASVTIVLITTLLAMRSDPSYWPAILSAQVWHFFPLFFRSSRRVGNDDTNKIHGRYVVFHRDSTEPSISFSPHGTSRPTDSPDSRRFTLSRGNPGGLSCFQEDRWTGRSLFLNVQHGE